MASSTSPLLILISAPSGAGKTTLCHQLMAVNAHLTRVVTCTTRAPRIGERDGVDYYFLNQLTFQQRVQAGDFLENATVYGNGYGILKSEVLGRMRNGQDVLLSVDVQGAATIRAEAARHHELARSLVTVFLAPPSLSALEQRLRGRGLDAPAVIAQRLGVARQEMAHWPQFDYLVVSATIPEDVRRVQVIIEAEKLRQARALPPELG